MTGHIPGTLYEKRRIGTSHDNRKNGKNATQRNTERGKISDSFGASTNLEKVASLISATKDQGTLGKYIANIIGKLTP